VLKKLFFYFYQCFWKIAIKGLREIITIDRLANIVGQICVLMELLNVCLRFNIFKFLKSCNKNMGNKKSRLITPSRLTVEKMKKLKKKSELA
jgi:hypothetical protein